MLKVRSETLTFAAAAALVLMLSTTGAAEAAAVPMLHRVASPNPGSGFNGLNGVAAFSANDAWAVGSQAPSGSPTSTAVLVERWNGHVWGASPAPQPAAGPAVLFGVGGSAPKDIWAVGYQQGRTLTEHWNGTKWSIVPSPNVQGGGILVGVSALAPNNAWAVGLWSDINGFPNTLVEHWNGSSWIIQPSPQTTNLVNQLTGVVALSPTNVWAVGFGQDPEFGETDAIIEHFDGTAWKMSPQAHGRFKSLSSIAATSSHDIWVAGYSADGSGPIHGLIEHWDGQSWSVVPSPDPDPHSVNTELMAVTAISKSDAWAVGFSQHTPGGPRTSIAEHWDGLHWNPVPVTGAGSTDNFLLGAARLASGQVWAVGQAADAGNIPKTLIAANCTLCARS